VNSEAGRRTQEGGGRHTELLTALQGLEKKVEAAAESESDAGFMLLGLPASGKEIEPLPKVAAALTGLLIIVESADVGPAADVVTASARWEEAAQETLAAGRVPKRRPGGCQCGARKSETEDTGHFSNDPRGCAGGSLSLCMETIRDQEAPGPVPFSARMRVSSGA